MKFKGYIENLTIQNNPIEISSLGHPERSYLPSIHTAKVNITLTEGDFADLALGVYGGEIELIIGKERKPKKVKRIKKPNRYIHKRRIRLGTLPVVPENDC